MDLEVTDDAIFQGCFFNQHTPEAEVIFRLYESKDMKATSIGFMPIDTRRIDGEDARKLGASFGIAPVFWTVGAFLAGGGVFARRR